MKQFVEASIAKLKEKSRYRTIKTSARIGDVYVERNGKKLISFCCNDYLGLSQHPQVINAAIIAVQKYGAGAGASRLVTGNHPLYNELERLLAKLNGTEAACVFGSGYLTNIGVIPALVGKEDLVVADKLVHSCIHDGVKLSGATYKRYSHNDLSNLSNILKNYRNNYKNCLIITEAVFSMDGDIAPLFEIKNLADKYNSWFMADGAHEIRVQSSEFRVQITRDKELRTKDKGQRTKDYIQMGTLSKAVGCYGGYVCASQSVIDYIKTSARSLIYSTALPPSIVASAIAAYRIIDGDKELCTLPLQKARLFTKLLDMAEAQSQIVPIIIGDEDKALNAAEELENDGFLVTAIRPPAVPEGTSRLRFTFSALHEDEDIERLASIIKAWNVL